MAMEFLPAAAVAATLILIALVSWIISRTNRRLPPGPFRLPILGHLHLIGTLPHKTFSDLSKTYGPVMLLWFGSVPTIVVSSAAAAREFICTHDVVFASRPKLSYIKYLFYDGYDLAFSDYNTSWKLMRKVSTTELFTARRMKETRTLREVQTLKLVTSVQREGCGGKVAVELRPLLSALSLNSVSLITFGVKMPSELLNAVEKVCNVILMGSFVLKDYFPYLPRLLDPRGNANIAEMKAAHSKMDQILQQIVDDHRASANTRNEYESDKDRDFVDVMLSLEGIDDRCIKGLILNLLIGGTESSASILEWALAELINSPAALSRAREELDTIVGRDRLVDESDIGKLSYLTNVVKEILRLHPPGPLLLPRRATQDTVVNGHFIPKNSTIHINVWAIGKDPSVWPSPDLFEPERFEGSSVDVKGTDFELIPFGAGRRICPGISLGMSLTCLALARLLHGFEWKAEEAKVNMEEVAGLAVRRKLPLKLFATPRLPTHVYGS